MTSDIRHDQIGKSLRFSEQEKRRLEREAAKIFMRAYEKQFNQAMRHIWHNEPAKPDISCYLENRPLDLEIAHLYANEHEARLIAGDNRLNDSIERYKGDEHLWMYLSELAQHNLDHKLETALGKILQNKAQKTYQSNRVWLVIRNASPLWDTDNFQTLLQSTAYQSILAEQNHHFENIWLIPDFLGHQPLLQLN